MTLGETMVEIEKLEAEKETLRSIATRYMGMTKRYQYLPGKFITKHERATERLAEMNG